MPDGWESVPGARRAAATVVCVTVALTFLLPGFGLVDLVTPFHLHEGGEVLDVGYGTLAGIVVPVAFLSQVRRTRPPIARLQLALAVALAAWGTEGLAVPGLAAAAAAAAWGAVTLVYPDHAGAKGSGWGLAAVLWALAFAAAVAWSARTGARRR